MPDPYFPTLNMPITIGQEFVDIATARSAFLTEALLQGTSFRVAKSDSKRHTAVCRCNDCPFQWHAAKHVGGMVKVTKAVDHNCSPAMHLSWKGGNRVAAHLPNHQAIVEADRRVAPHTIITNERVMHGHELPYRQAHRIRKAARERIEGNAAETFKRLPSYFDQLHAVSLSTTAVLEITGNRFLRCFIAPAAVKQAAETLRPFVALDGAHCTSPYGDILLLAVGLNANNKTLPLAWGIVPVEDGNHWKWFMQQFHAAFPALTGLHAVLISDRDKGLVASIQEMVPQCHAARCCQHLADNIAKRYGAACRPLFWACAYAKSLDAYETAALALRQHHVAAADWLHAIDKQSWAAHAFPAPRFGNLTFNCYELGFISEEGH
jgi:hypothetical protein